MWIDDDLIFPMEETFGEICKKNDPFPVDYLFYEPSLKFKFEEKFKLHFKYYQIGYSNLEMFKDHFKDILDLNYPKYKHYYDTLEKAKTLKWWNNKDFVTEFTRQLDKQEGTTFVSTLDKLDKMVKTLEKTGSVNDSYNRALKEKTVEKGRNDITNNLKKSGTNVTVMNKGTTVEDSFERNLTSTEVHKNTDSKKNNSINTNSASSNATNNSNSEDTSNNTTKNLDTPQGTINNLIDNVNAYMTTATVDSGRDTNKSNSTASTTNEGKSEDVTLSSSTENKDIKGTEGGTSLNVTTTTGSDNKEETLGETHETTASDVKASDVTLDKTGQATDIKTYNTTDKTTRIVTDTDTTNSNEEMTGQDNETYTKKEEGNIGVTSAGQLVNDWLKWGYVTLDKMIIRDCEKLFLQVY